MPGLNSRDHAGLVALAALGAALSSGCDPAHLEAVGAPGGPFHSGAGCRLDQLAAGAASCAPEAQLAFERPGDEALFSVAIGNLSARELSCRRSYCGTGALKLHADYRWRAGANPPASDKLGELRHRLPAPTELYGKTLTYALYLEGPVTPVNAYVAVIDSGGVFHMVHDEPVLLFNRWTQRGAAITTLNRLINLPPGATSLVATELRIAVYLATDVRTGDLERWTADVYIDQLGWN